MALADTANLIVNLSLKGNFQQQLSKTQRTLGKFDASLDRSETRAFRFGQQIGTGIRRSAALAAGGLAFLALNVAQGLESLVELEKQTAQTNAVIKSTGKVAGITATKVGELAEKYEGLNATIGDEVIRSSENLLLTFTNVRKKAFEPALLAILDMNQALGRGEGGLQQTTLQVGKALQDPIRGITALRRAGVNFTKAQEKKIKSLIKEGKLYEAQGLILKELQKEFGGSFLAGGGTTAGKVAKFRDSIEDLQRSLAAGLLPVVSNIADALSELFADPAIQSGIKTFGEDLAKVLTPAAIKGFISDVKDFAGVVAPAFKAAAGGIGLVASAFAKLPPDLRNLLIGAVAVNKLTGGIVTNVAGGLASAIGSALRTIFAANVTVVGKNVIGGGVPGVAGAAKGGLGAISKVFLVGEAIGLTLLVEAVRQDLSQQNTVLAGKIQDNTNAFLKQNPATADLRNALNGVNAGIRDLTSNPLNVLVQGEALDNLRAMQLQLHTALRTREGTQNPDVRDRRNSDQLAAIAAALIRVGDRPGERGTGKAQGPSTATQNDIRELAGKLTPGLNTVIPGAIASLQTNSIASINTLGAGVKGQVASSSQINASRITSATAASTNAIVGAIWAARPIVNVTNVTKTTTIQNRYGPPNGSYGTPSGNQP